jgi:hypothetical protein
MTESFISNSIFILIICFLLFFVAKFKFFEYKKNNDRKKRFNRGIKLETEAASFLEKKGFKIVSDQEIHYHSYKVNGQQRKSKLILDYVVEKSGKKYIVEVKSGKNAISLNDKNSRRQILEYDFVIENDGIFLLDMESKNMQLVKFEPKQEKQDEFFRKFILTIAVIGVLAPFWKVRILIGLIMLVIWKFPNKSKEVLVFFSSLKF